MLVKVPHITPICFDKITVPLIKCGDTSFMQKMTNSRKKIDCPIKVALKFIGYP